MTPGRPSGRALPPAHVIRASLHVARVIDNSGTPATTARDTYVGLPTGGLYHHDDLIAGEELLLNCHLLEERQGTLYPGAGLTTLLEISDADACELIISRLFTEIPPVWFFSAIGRDGFRIEMVPDADMLTLEEIVPDAARREAFLLAQGRVVDYSGDAELGAAGEELVVAECRQELQEKGRPDLAELVQRVSLITDQLGYDVVAPTLQQDSRRLEVKTTGRPGRSFEVTVSRGEIEVGLRDPSWALIACQLDGIHPPRVVGWMRGDVLETMLPSDEDPRCRWASVTVVLSPDVLASGLPPCI